MSPCVRVAAAAFILGTAFFIHSPARSADASAVKMSVAFVDMARVMNEAKPVAALQSEFQESRKQQQKLLDNLYAGRLLDDKERTELESLQGESTPTDTQRNRIAELSKLSDDREQEMSRLSRLEKPTDGDRARLTQLTNWLQKQNQRAVQARQDLDQSANQKVAQLNKRAMDTVLAAIQAIAEARGIDLVVDRQSVLFGRDSGNLTDEVLQHLNNGVAASAPSGNPATVSKNNAPTTTFTTNKSKGH